MVPSLYFQFEKDIVSEYILHLIKGWSGVAMVLGKLPYDLDYKGQGSTALAVGAGGGCLDIFTLIYPFSPLSPSLWEKARYRLKYCFKGPLNPKQPTNHLIHTSRPYCCHLVEEILFKKFTLRNQ